jgi:DNA-binding protein HU-beta
MASRPAAKTKTVAAPKTAAKKPRKTVAAVSPPSAAKKPTPEAAPKKAAQTVTLKTVFEQLAEAQDMPKKQALAMAAGMVDLVTGILKAGDRVRLSGLDAGARAKQHIVGPWRDRLHDRRRSLR